MIQGRHQDEQIKNISENPEAWVCVCGGYHSVTFVLSAWPCATPQPDKGERERERERETENNIPA